MICFVSTYKAKKQVLARNTLTQIEKMITVAQAVAFMLKEMSVIFIAHLPIFRNEGVKKTSFVASEEYNILPNNPFFMNMNLQSNFWSYEHQI